MLVWLLWLGAECDLVRVAWFLFVLCVGSLVVVLCVAWLLCFVLVAWLLCSFMLVLLLWLGTGCVLSMYYWYSVFLCATCVGSTGIFCKMDFGVGFFWKRKYKNLLELSRIERSKLLNLLENSAISVNTIFFSWNVLLIISCKFKSSTFKFCFCSKRQFVQQR
jgi:hypothetical protein